MLSDLYAPILLVSFLDEEDEEEINGRPGLRLLVMMAWIN